MNFKYTESDAPLSSIKSIQFSLLDDEQIKRLSVAEITSYELYDKGCPVVGGLYDLRMGTTDKQFKCQTCNCDVLDCQGHFGHIELCEPIYNILYLKTIYKLVQCVCVNCSRILYKPDEKNKKTINALKSIQTNIKKNMICEYCEYKQPKYQLDNCKISITQNEETTVLSAKSVFQIIRKITDCKELGFNDELYHPKSMFIVNLLVPPPAVRPSIIIDSSLKSQDDLTHKLSEILKCNIQLKKCKENVNSSEHIINEFINLLQFHVSSYIDNEIPGQPQATQRTGRPIKSICQRLKSKEGRVRGNLMGKRVDFSARTVITADPNIKLDELGVPKQIADNLTIPETINNFNIEIYQKQIDNGNNGPTTIKWLTKNKKKKDMRFAKNVKLEIGDVIERTLKDGDYVVFNRQPSLHKMSMMGHKIKVMPNLTFRLNLSATSPYNADFDGDEMNMHVPQTQETRTEIKELMMVSNCIVSPQSNKPVMGIVQDSLLASRKMTLRSVFVDKMTLMNILMKLESFDYSKIPQPTIFKPKQLWTGKQLISIILPNISLSKKNGWHDENDLNCFSNNDTEVLIKDGELLSGILCKKILGSSSGSLIHCLWLEFGSEETCRFISELQYVVNEWIMSIGFTCSFSDGFCKSSCYSSVNSIINNANEDVRKILYQKHDKKSETKINMLLNNARDKAGMCVCNELNIENNIHTMVSGGSKGSIINISQIMACVGQQNVNGNRIDFGYNERTLPHFEKNDHSAESRGFVKHSYMDGLTPNEFFFHAMGGREGVIDTAVKTSETGYIQRRLVKAMEDLKICSDLTVRNSLGDLLQLRYGEDSMDACKLITQNIPKIKLYENIQYTTTNQQLIDIEQQNMKNAIELISQMNLSRIHLPFNLEKIVLKYKVEIKNEKFDYDNIIILVNDFCETLNENKLFKAIIQIILYSKKLYVEYKLNLEEIKKIIYELQYNYERSKINIGEMVGTIAAQSLGEPITQLTLNTFHAAGISEKNVTLGVPRLKELINVSKNIKCPSMFLKVKDGSNIEDLQYKLECVMLYEVINEIQIEDDLSYHTMELNYFKFMDIDTECMSKWSLTIIMKDNVENTTTIEISTSLLKSFENIYITAFHENLGNKLVIRFKKNENECDFETILSFKNELFLKYIIRGNSKIQKIYIKDDMFMETDGSTLQDVLHLNGVDVNNSFSNDILEMYTLFGIEAARNCLINELRNVIEFDGSYVNYRHLCLLVETMTYKGNIMAITRHGINRTNAGPLMKCSFEETVNVLTDAAINGEQDCLMGVTENIILGKISKIGTSNFEVLLDYNKLQRNDNLVKYKIQECVYKDDNNSFRPSTPQNIT